MSDRQQRADVPLATGDSMVRNTAFALAGQLTGAVFTAGLTLFLVRSLGAAGYGVFALAVGIGAVVLFVSDFGITPSASRFIAEHPRDRAAVAAFVADAFRLKLLATGGVCAALVALAGPIADAYGNADLAWPLRAVAIAVFGQSMLFLCRGLFVSIGRVAITWRIMFLESAVETGASVAFVLGGAGAAGAAFGRTTGYVLGAAVAALLVVRALGREAITSRAGTASRKRQIAGYAGPMFLVSAAFTLFEQIDVLLIGGFLGTTAVGLFEAPMRVAMFLGYGGQAAALGVAPRLARDRGAIESDRAATVRAFEVATRYLIMLQAALVAPVLVWADPIVSLALGSEYEGSVGVLRALAPFVFLSGLGTFVTLGVNYLGEARRRVPLAIGAVLVNLALDLILIPSIGVIGGAVGTDIAFALYVLAHFWISSRMLSFATRPLLRTLVRSMIAASAMAAVLAAFGTSDLTPLQLVLGAVGATVAYCLMLVLTGELSRRELADARHSVARWARTGLGRQVDLEP